MDLHHDVGFMWMPTAVAHYRCDGNEQARVRGLKAANLLAGRFNLAGHFLRAWNDGEWEDSQGLAIIDCLMNLSLLYWASREINDPRFCQIALAHAETVLENFVRDRFGVKVRSIELNVNQRCSSLLASAADVDEAILSGRTAVKQSLKGATGCMVSCSRADGPGYRLEFGLTDVGNVCNKEKGFPLEWITPCGTDISPAFHEYALPLIAGEPERIMENGLP